eukprot:c23188_g1_i2 orf=395-787(+)
MHTDHKLTCHARLCRLHDVGFSFSLLIFTTSQAKSLFSSQLHVVSLPLTNSILLTLPPSLQELGRGCLTPASCNLAGVRPIYDPFVTGETQADSLVQGSPAPSLAGDSLTLRGRTNWPAHLLFSWWGGGP